jgi:hypothetical protein
MLGLYRITVQADKQSMTANQAIDWRKLPNKRAGWHFFHDAL